MRSGNWRTGESLEQIGVGKVSLKWKERPVKSGRHDKTQEIPNLTQPTKAIHNKFRYSHQHDSLEMVLVFIEFFQLV